LEAKPGFSDVAPYTNDDQPITNVQVVNAATAFIDESTGETVILHFNQVLWYGKAHPYREQKLGCKTDPQLFFKTLSTPHPY
jgi:hypothetical protein